MLCKYTFEKSSWMQFLLILILLDKKIINYVQFQAAETFSKAVLSDILMMNDAEVHIVLGNGLFSYNFGSQI